MSKIKHTKNELKKQKDDLKRFTRYLPTLLLKKKQLQLEIIKIAKNMEDAEIRIKEFKESIHSWVAVFGENTGIEKIVRVERIHTSAGNIAGLDIPVFESVDFKEKKYSFFEMPLWVDYGIEVIKEAATLKIKHEIFEEQLKLAKEELRITAQRVNLFEKIKIPEARENIRKIRIFLGDMQTAAVVTGKIAKRQIEDRVKAEA